MVSAEDAPASAHVAGGPAAKPHKEPPNVAQAKPERGLGELRGVRPDQLGAVFGAVHAAATADVAQTEGEQGKDLGKGYSVDLIERKQNTRGSKGYDYAALVRIEVLRSAKTDVLLNPKNARLGPSATTPNRDVLQTRGLTWTQ